MAQTKLRTAQIPTDIDGTMAANSDVVVPSQKAVVTYVGAHGGGGAILAEDEGTLLGTGTVFNFRGPNITATISGSVVDVFVSGSAGSQGPAGPAGAFGVVALDEGTLLGTGTTMNFVGGGVTATISGSNINVSVPASTAVAGALVLLEWHTGSNSASLNFTGAFSDLYDQYVLDVSEFVPGTNTQELYLRFSIDGGATYTSSGGYYWHVSDLFYDGDNLVNGGRGDNVGQISLVGSNPAMNNGAGVSSNVVFHIHGARNPNLHTSLHGTFSAGASNGAWGFGFGGGLWKTTAVVNALQLRAASGNITSGIARLFGVQKTT